MTDHILNLGISPCPNDTFIFEEWILAEPSSWLTPPKVNFADVQTLNEMALNELSSESTRESKSESLAQCPDVLKISAATWVQLNRNSGLKKNEGQPGYENPWQLLNCGGAMGYGCGPLLLSFDSKELNPDHPILLPGKNTTATLLYRFWREHFVADNHADSEANSEVSIPEEFCFFDELYERLKSGRAHQGVVIHESRFLWEKDHLNLISDLGAFWEEQTKSPIPLGVIVARKSLGADTIAQIEKLIRASLQNANDRDQMITPFIRSHAQEMDEEVMRQHIETFVNSFSMDIGEEGRRALAALGQF